MPQQNLFAVPAAMRGITLRLEQDPSLPAGTERLTITLHMTKGVLEERSITLDDSMSLLKVGVDLVGVIEAYQWGTKPDMVWLALKNLERHARALAAGGF